MLSRGHTHRAVLFVRLPPRTACCGSPWLDCGPGRRSCLWNVGHAPQSFENMRVLSLRSSDGASIVCNKWRSTWRMASSLTLVQQRGKICNNSYCFNACVRTEGRLLGSKAKAEQCAMLMSPASTTRTFWIGSGGGGALIQCMLLRTYYRRRRWRCWRRNTTGRTRMRISTKTAITKEITLTLTFAP